MVQLVDDHRDEHGLNSCLEALGLNKSTYYYRKQEYPRSQADDERLRGVLVEIIDEHPSYGWRRLLPELEERTGETINHKRLKRLLDKFELSLSRNVRAHDGGVIQRTLNEASGELDLVSDRDSFEPLEVFSCDFTELHYDGGSRKAYLIAMVDLDSKWVPGWAVARSANRQLALECWQRTKRSLSALDDRDAAETIVHQDLDSVFTSHAWINQLLLEDEVTLSFSENGAKDNPWIESLWSRIKDEIDSRIKNASTLKQLQEVIDERFDYYNDNRRHSSLDNQPPLSYLVTELELEKITSDLSPN